MATQFRAADGSGNKLADPTLNQTGDGLLRTTAQHPTVFDFNPRVISNAVVGQGEASVENKAGLSELFTTFGQFLDHDLDRVLAGGADISVPVPAGDAFFPAGSPIPVTKAQVNAAGQPVNSITGWIDGSQIYGSSQATANSLKAADGAHLATSDGNNLPIVNGRFVAGDGRVMENDYLTSIQTIWMREHNFQVDKLQAANPALAGEALYQQAKAVVVAELQDVIYHEWLPKLLGNGSIKPYKGYDASVDATISPEFAGAAFRFGHSLVGDDIQKVDNANHTLSERSLAADFLDGVDNFLPDGGANSLIRAQTVEVANELDARIVSELRNFLVDGGPVSDLAATNIRRGEDFGLGTLNQTRHDLGLHEHNNVNALTNDKGTRDALQSVYPTVNDVDLWVGGLAEKHTKGGQLGETFNAIVSDQFTRLRDGDRFYYENTQNGNGFTPAEIAAITATDFQDIIVRNTDIVGLSADPFTAHLLDPLHIV